MSGAPDPSANPFAAPQVETAHVPPSYGDIDLADALAGAWQAFTSSFGAWVGAMISAGLAMLLVLGVVSMIGVLNPIAGGVSMLFMFPVGLLLGWGFTLFTVRCVDGTAQARDIFDGFDGVGPKLWRMLGLVIMQGFIIPLPGYAPTFAAPFLGESLAVEVLAVGWIAAMAWQLFVGVRFVFAPFFVVDQGRGVIDALQASWSATSHQKMMTVLLMFAMSLVMTAGVFLLVVGMVFSIQIGWDMVAVAYRQVAGAPEPAP